MEFSDSLTAFARHYARQLDGRDLEHGAPEQPASPLAIASPVLRPEPGNHPKILHHGAAGADALVLVHGFTDAPYYMEAIAEGFHRRGVNVVLPLLPGHDRRRAAPAMDRATLADWQTEVGFAVEVARGLGRRVSIGGLSTGGALSVWKALTDRQAITGGLFLFAPALAIPRTSHVLVASPVGRLVAMLVDRARGRVDADSYGLGQNPYKYNGTFARCGHQVVVLIRSIHRRYASRAARYADLGKPVFAACSADDERVSFAEVERLIAHQPSGNPARLFALREQPPVKHADVVLAQDIPAPEMGAQEPKRNPRFAEMMEEILEFFAAHVQGSG